MADRKALRTVVRGAYDVQKLRIEMGNRIVANFKAKLGQKPQKREETMDSEGRALLAELRARFKKLTDGVKTFPKSKGFDGDELISTYTELCLLDQYVRLEKAEASHFKQLEGVLRDFPIYTEFLEDVAGIGPAMAGVIVSEIDIHKARYASSLWAYAGLDVAADGRGRSRRKEHLRTIEYADKNGKPATRQGITFNPFLKMKLTGVLGASFLRVRESPYKTLYYEYKHRLENHERYGTERDGQRDADGHLVTSKLRRHTMAIRYMIKRFLADLYAVWREIEGLPVENEYAQDKLGRRHDEKSGESEAA